MNVILFVTHSLTGQMGVDFEKVL